MKPRLSLMIHTLVCALALQGCSCAVGVSVIGNLQHGVSFEVTDQRRIVFVGLRVREDSGDWRSVWRLEGSRKVQSIRYGENIKGFRVLVAPEKLSAGRIYRLSIESDAWMKQTCVGGETFTIEPDGAIKICSHVNSCR